MRDTTSDEHAGALEIMRIDDVERDLRAEDQVARAPQKDPTDVIDIPLGPSRFVRLHDVVGRRRAVRQPVVALHGRAPMRLGQVVSAPDSWGSCPAPTARTPDRFARHPHASPNPDRPPPAACPDRPVPRSRCVAHRGRQRTPPVGTPRPSHQRRQDHRHARPNLGPCRESGLGSSCCSIRTPKTSPNTDTCHRRWRFSRRLAALRRRRSTDAAVAGRRHTIGTRHTPAATDRQWRSSANSSERVAPSNSRRRLRERMLWLLTTPGGDAHNLGDCLHTQVVPVAQDDDRPIPQRQGGDRVQQGHAQLGRMFLAPHPAAPTSPTRGWSDAAAGRSCTAAASCGRTRAGRRPGGPASSWRTPWPASSG